MSEGTDNAIDLQFKLSLPKQSARPRYHVLCQPRNICLLLRSHRSCFSFQASRQRAAAGQVCSPGGPVLTWTLRSQRRGKVRLRLQDTSLRVSTVKVGGDQSEGGIATHWPIRVTKIVLLNSSLFFLLSPFSLSHPGHWNNIEQEWRRREKIFCRWYKILISDFNWITLF